MSTLIILLPSPQQLAGAAVNASADLGMAAATHGLSRVDMHWLVQQNGRPLQQGYGRLDAAPLTTVRNWLAVLPAESCSWHRVHLPAKTAQRHLRSVLEGLLEEQVLGDVEQLHFALPPGRTSSGEVTVCCTQRAWLKQCQTALTEMMPQAAGRLLPEGLPLVANAATAKASPRWAYRAILRRDASLDQDILLLPEAFAARVWPIPPDLQAWPSSGLAALKRMQIWVDPQCASRADALFGPQSQAVNTESEGEAAADSPARAHWQLVDTGARLLRIAQEPSQWDLAQFELAQAQGLAARWQRHAAVRGLKTWVLAPQWRQARKALLGLLLIHLLGLNAYAWHQSRALRAKEQQIKAILTQQFPDITVIVEPLAQMRQAVQQLQDLHADGAQARGLAAMLETLQEAQPQLVILQIQYTEQNLQVHTLDSKLGDAGVQARLAQKGLQLQPMGQGNDGATIWQVQWAAPLAPDGAGTGTGAEALRMSGASHAAPSKAEADTALSFKSTTSAAVFLPPGYTAATRREVARAETSQDLVW